VLCWQDVESTLLTQRGAAEIWSYLRYSAADLAAGGVVHSMGLLGSLLDALM
jgi:hypothetical protein